MLAHDGVVFAEAHFFCGIARVFLGDIEKASVSGAGDIGVIFALSKIRQKPVRLHPNLSKFSELGEHQLGQLFLLLAAKNG